MPQASALIALHVGDVHKVVSIEGLTGEITVEDGWNFGGLETGEPLEMGTIGVPLP
jgi:hypothetical protein